MNKRWALKAVLAMPLAVIAMPFLFANETNAKRGAFTDQLQIQCKIVVTNGAGEQEVLACPTVRTVVGEPAMISYTDPNGRKIEIQMLGELIPAHEIEKADNALAE